MILATRDLNARQWFENTMQDVTGGYRVQQLLDTMQIDVFYTGSEESFGEPAIRGRLLENDESGKTSHAKDIHVKATASSNERSTSTNQASISIRHAKSRPDLVSILNIEFSSAYPGEQVGIFVCGPLSMQAGMASMIVQQQVRVMKTFICTRSTFHGLGRRQTHRSGLPQGSWESLHPWR